jgi:hypothetical protein
MPFAFLLHTFYFILLPLAFAGGNADLADLTETHGFSTALKINRLSRIFWSLSDHSDYAEGTNNSLNSMKKLNHRIARITTDLWPLRDHLNEAEAELN